MADTEQPERNWRKFARLKDNRRFLRRSARKIENATLKHAHRFIIRRLDNVRDVKRHTLSWLALMLLLIGLSIMQLNIYQQAFTEVKSIPGGTYAEGVVGSLDTINPIFATTKAEQAASRLIFGSLLSYDRQNTLRGELAQTWTTTDEGKTYVVTMRDNLRWHDGKPLTVDDVIFTINLIKNPQVNSPLYNSWSEVSVQKQGTNQIIFSLPAPYAPFPHALTFGILPKHSLNTTLPERLRESSFNRSPIGSGPFEFRNLQIISSDATRLVVYMNAFDDYVFGRPKLERFQLHTYKDQAELKQGFLTDEISAAADLTTTDIASIVKEKPATEVSNAHIDNGVFALFRNDSPVLKNQSVREALRLATNRPGIISSLNNYASLLEGPLTRDQLQVPLRQPGFDLNAAKQKLEADGWHIGADRVRAKDGQPLTISLVAPRTGDYPSVVKQLTEQWQALGVKVQADLVSPATIQQNVLVPRAYDVLVYELANGADPDVFAYWHSSQVGPRGRNLANYSSGVADDALTSARTRRDMALRNAKYENFVRQWLGDVPAIALYQPTLHYVSNPNVQTIPASTVIPDSITRYRAVEYWTVDQASVNKTF